MKRTFSAALILCLLLSCVMLFGGCSKESTREYPVTLGGVTIEKEPKNIVVLSANFADIISYIGYDVKMVGRSSECDQKFLHVVPIMGSAASPDIDAITAAETDLVIADNTLGADVRNRIEEAGVQVLTLDPATTEAALRERYADLGVALGGDVTGRQRGEEGYDELFEMLRTLNTSVKTDVVRTAAYLYLNENGELCTFVKGSLEYKFFSYNGSTNIFSNQTEPVVNLSDLRIGSPNYLFYDSPEVLEVLNADENLTNLKALVDGRTCMIEKRNFERQGTSAEAAVFDMLNFIEKDSKATADEAASPTAAAISEVTEAPVEETTDDPEEETTAEIADDENVITYSISDDSVIY